ncbi:MAG: translocation/assembly module TamB domain-containing protein [Candidatus Acidiferrales bacterium]
MSRVKTIRRVISITLAAIAVLIAAAFILVHTSFVSGYVRGKLTEVAEAKVDARVTIKKLSFAWDHLGVTLHGITIRGRGTSSRPLLFQVSKLAVQVELPPLLHGQFKLGEVALDHPVVHFDVNEQGHTNIPTPASATNLPKSSSSSSSVETLFKLGIRRLIITNGTIYYEDVKIPLSADLADFGANVRFNGGSQEYSGTIGYKDGRIRIKNLAPVKTTATLRFTASRSGMTCSPLTITMPKSELSVYATVQNYSNPLVSGKYAADLSMQEVAKVIGSSALATGKVSANGTLRYQGAQGQSFLDGLQLEGTLSSPHLALKMRQFTAPANSLHASYALDNGNLRITRLRGQVLGGDLSANNGELSLAGQSSSHLSATLTNVSLQAASEALPPGPYSQLSLSGRADLSAQLSWAGNFSHLAVHSRVTITSPPQASLRAGRIPLNGVVQVAYNKAKDQASFGNSHLRIGDTTISVTGLLNKHSNLKLELATSNLRQFSTVAARIEEAMSSKGPAASFRMPNLTGSARFQGRVNGSLQNPQLHGHLTANHVGLRSTEWKTIQANVILSPSHAALSNGLLVSNREGRIQFDASTGLRRWSLAPSSPIELRATVGRLQLASLQTLANVSYPVSGVLSADISVQGTKINPSGHGWLRIANATAWKQPVTLATLNFHGDAASLHANLAVETPAGALSGNLQYDANSKHYQVDLTAPALELGKIELVHERHLAIRGTLAASASGRGSIANPELAAKLRIPQLEFRGQTISNAESQWNLADRRVNFTANAGIDGGKLQAKGQVELTGEYMTTATLDIHSVSVGMLAVRYVPKTQPGLKGSVDLHAEIHGPLKDPSQLTIRAEVPAMSLEYQAMRVALVRPLQMEYHDGIATLQKSEIKGTGIDLTLQGAIPIKSAAPFKIAANGTVNMKLLQQMITGIQSSGQMQVAIAGGGKLSNPSLQGNLRLQNVSLSSVSLPVEMSGINGDIRMSGHQLEIATLEGGVNGGSMTAQGSVDIGKQPTFDLSVDTKSVDINYPAGIRTRLDANLRLNGATSHSALTGRVVIDYLGFTQRQMDITSLVSQFGSSGGASTPSKFEKNTKLNVAVQSSSTLNLASNQLSVQGAANLDVVGTLANPVVLGRTTLTGGELFFLGKRYEIKSGTIEFANPTQTKPSVNLYATTTVNQYDISLHFLGPVDQMKTSFTSTPALAPADIINLLAFGQTTEEAASNPTPGALGAESVLAQGVASQLSGKIQKLAGISQLSITPTLASGQQNPGAQVAIQQRVSGRLLVTFTTNTAATQSTAVQVQYQLGHGLSISVLRDQYGGYGVDLHLHKSF